MKFFNILIFCEYLVTSIALNDSCIKKSGGIGICKPISECNEIIENFKLGNLNHLEPCNFSDLIGFFCCPVSFNYSPVVHKKFSTSCQKIIQTRERLIDNDYEYNENSRKSSVYELPFMVQILFRKKGFVGAGVLLSEQFVLTAAHTVYTRRSMPIVRFAKSTLDEHNLLRGFDLSVKQVIPHELYIPREIYYDIALLALEHPMKIHNLAFPVCLHNPQIDLTNDQIFILAGWKGNNGNKFNELIKGEVRKVPQSECEVIYNRTDYRVKLPDGIQDNLFCGEFNGCRDCPDSDGPILIHSNKTFFIYGFTTLTNTHRDSELPGIYTKITDIAEWIENIISSKIDP